jgi:cytochrome c biogenesis protein CcmG, thiol:disulfide interchange protein DsbE
MKKFIVVILLLSTILFLSASFVLAGEASLAQDFTLQDIQGNKVNLSAYRNGQPVMLFFWTTWCPFCRDGLKALSAKYAGLEKAGAKVLVINTGETASRVNSFIQKNPLAFNVLLDTTSTVAYSYEIVGVPTYIVINKDGEIIFRDNYFPEDFEKLLVQ